jgi:hypothetical protein
MNQIARQPAVGPITGKDRFRLESMHPDFAQWKWEEKLAERPKDKKRQLEASILDPH